jgi:hypothetical protein
MDDLVGDERDWRETGMGNEDDRHQQMRKNKYGGFFTVRRTMRLSVLSVELTP